MRKYIANYSISETGKNRTLIGLKAIPSECDIDADSVKIEP